MELRNKNYEQIRAIAKENKLSTRELTSGSNGYPKNLRLCVTGFDTYEQAKNFADNNGGNVTSIIRRDGWQFSMSDGNVDGAYNIYIMLVNDYQHESIEILRNNESDINEYLYNTKNILKDKMDGAKDFDTLRDLTEAINKACDIAEEAETLDDDELLLVKDGETEVMKQFDTHYTYDVCTYDIAVEFPD